MARTTEPAWTEERIRAVLDCYAELTPADLSPELRAVLTDVERALDCLTPKQRGVIACMYLSLRWTTREVGEALGVSHVAAIGIRDEAIRRMAGLLEERVTKHPPETVI